MALFVAFFLLNVTGWQTFTHPKYIFDICGDNISVNLATAGGVVVLDSRFEPPLVKRRFVHTDGVGVNRCLAIAKDGAGHLWVGTDGVGLVLIPSDSSWAVSYRTAELPLRLRAVVVENNKVLVGTDEGMFVIDTRGTPLNFSDDTINHFRVSVVRELLSDQIRAFFAANERYWIGTNRGLSSVDTGLTHWLAYPRPLGDSVLAIGALPDGRIVIGTEAGVGIGDTAGFRPLIEFSSAKTVTDLTVCGEEIYLAAGDTLFKIDTVGDAIPVLVSKPRVLWAREKLWVGLGGSEDAGWGLLYQRSGSAWEDVPLGGLAGGFISDCAFGKDGSVYLGHNSSWFSRILPDGNVRIINSPLPWVVQIRSDSRGRLWFSHFSYQGGLSVYDPEADTWGVVQWGNSSARNVIQAFGLDKKDTKWVYNLAGMVVAIDSTGRQQEFVLPELTPPPDGSYEFAFDTRNRVWLGLTNGLEEFDYHGTLFDLNDDYHTLHTSGLPSLQVRSIAVDHLDRVWVATPQGGAVWDGRAFKVYNTGNSPLISNNLFRVRVDGAGRVWFLSDKGLSIFDPATGRWSSYTPQNSGIIPNPQGLANFYTALDLDDFRGVAGLGSARGFSLFRYALESETTLAGIRVYPNPCVLGLHSGVVIEGLPADARVQVYTVSGQPVADLTISPGMGRAVWYPGRVASGLYLLVATSSGRVRVEKVALVVPGGN
ncbi:MAG: hypothetical protein ACUVUD_04545 [bacterium]